MTKKQEICFGCDFNKNLEIYWHKWLFDTFVICNNFVTLPQKFASSLFSFLLQQSWIFMNFPLVFVFVYYWKVKLLSSQESQFLFRNCWDIIKSPKNWCTSSHSLVRTTNRKWVETVVLKSPAHENGVRWQRESRRQQLVTGFFLLSLNQNFKGRRPRVAGFFLCELEFGIIKSLTYKIKFKEAVAIVWQNHGHLVKSEIQWHQLDSVSTNSRGLLVPGKDHQWV